MRVVKLGDVDTRIENEIGLLRTSMEAVKFNILQYAFAVMSGTGALLLAYLRMLVFRLASVIEKRVADSLFSKVCSLSEDVAGRRELECACITPCTPLRRCNVLPIVLPQKSLHTSTSKLSDVGPKQCWPKYSHLLLWLSTEVTQNNVCPKERVLVILDLLTSASSTTHPSPAAIVPSSSSSTTSAIPKSSS